MHRHLAPRYCVAALVALLFPALFALNGCDNPGEIEVLEAALEPGQEAWLEDIGMPQVAQEIPTTVTAYDVDELCERIPLNVMRYELDVMAAPQQVANMPGMVFVVDGAKRLTMYPDGTATFVDQQHLGPNSPPIQPVPDVELLDHGLALLDDMGALDDPYVTVQAANVVANWAEPQGVGDATLTHQTASFRQKVDHVPAFGPGARLEIVYPGDILPVAFNHSLRCLQPEQTDATLSPAEAVIAWRIRIENGGAWNVLDQDLETFASAEVFRIEMGHYIPSAGEAAPTIEPMYKISGVASGVGTGGAAADVPFLWYQPAIHGRPLPPAIQSL
ncbi:MAG: hypothetical protein QGH45_20205 [Myxococcota bacterium]|jgi:hypothetical protein|nr:hypothetical protein [Myxococcota bacterium]